MLYDAESSLSHDAQSSCDVETVLARQLGDLSTAAPSARTAQKQKLIHFMQDKHIRLPHVFVRYGTQVLKNAASKLGNAAWDLYERVYIASLDAHDSAVSSWCLGALDAQFPGSTRVARLKGMGLEARGSFAQAAAFYAELLADDPTHLGLARRQVACAKGAGDLPRAIGLLASYVRSFAADESAWAELAELYVQAGQYDLAAFALEELILLAPENYVYYTKYAEVQYTLGAMDVARAYFAQALELKPTNNLRALYGLVLALQSKGGAAGCANAADLYKWSAEQLLAHYRKFQPELLDAAKSVLGGAENTANTAATATNATTGTSTPTTTTPVAQTEEEPTEPRETELPD